LHGFTFSEKNVRLATLACHSAAVAEYSVDLIR